MILSATIDTDAFSAYYKSDFIIKVQAMQKPIYTLTYNDLPFINQESVMSSVSNLASCIQNI
jgi:hypothetical protein